MKERAERGENAGLAVPVKGVRESGAGNVLIRHLHSTWGH